MFPNNIKLDSKLKKTRFFCYNRKTLNKLAKSYSKNGKVKTMNKDIHTNTLTILANDFDKITISKSLLKQIKTITSYKE